VVSDLTTADALMKVFVYKAMITQTEFMAKLSAERAMYQYLLHKKVKQDEWLQ
jgi:tRNA U38,U39,U40 pseudouridine synthase TruA